jgi:hypothetical protein
MKAEIEIDDDAIEELLREQLVSHYFMVSTDIKEGAHEDDLKWMKPVKDAFHTLLTLYYSTKKQRDEFLEQVKEFENGS